MTTPSICPKCGIALPIGGGDQTCPKCLLQLAMTQTDTLRHTLSDIHATVTTAPLGLLPSVKLTHGQIFGNYRIYDMLGRGGMGEVYEAEELESGRRLALKVLGHKINSDEARKRFIREGRMAASVNHPNSVYVFGTTEIQGRPVITMELVPGGTLKDVVKRNGPLTPNKAATAILQLIEGLEAAYEKGVLHRDVKPANCFVDPQGDVKVGDYGLSISTLNKDDSHVTAFGTFMGTPAFASPEQLRGDDLDARSDIYAVGVTLHFLLTGKAPFEENNFVRLMARVLEDAPPNITALDPVIPIGLSQIVSKCLAKSPDQRFRNYAEFRDALTPFGVTSSSSPHTVSRIIAFIVDLIAIVMIAMALELVVFGARILETSTTPLLSFMIGPLLTFTYFAVSEGLTGTTISKKQFGLRVVQQNGSGSSCTMRQALVRASFISLLPSLLGFILIIFNPSNLNDPQTLAMLIATIFYYVCYLSFYVTMRRSNGMATLFDLISKTRVVQTNIPGKRPTTQLQANEIANVVDGPKVGPYHVMSDLGTMPDMPKAKGIRTMLGYDPQLFRKVWIRQYSSTPPNVSTTLRHITRFGRLRWLSGQRAEEADGSWDAFEAPTGRPFLTTINTPMAWSQIRHLIADITQELAIADTDGTMPETLGLDRLWITLDGRAKILDFRAPGLSDAQADISWKPEPVNGVQTAHKLINQIAVAALHGISTGDEREFKLPLKPIPVHARKFLNDLAQMKTLSLLNAAAQNILKKTADVSRKNKWGVVGCFSAFTAFLMVIVIAAMPSSYHNEENTLIFFGYLILILLLVAIVIGAAPCLLANIAFNCSPVMSFCGLELVGERGENPGRLRRGARTLVVWSPAILAAAILTFMLKYSNQSPALWIMVCTLLVVFFTVATFSVISGKRSMVDRIVGTWLTSK
jgi:eukaryotic-like serine/threonine-protein kinase